MNTTVLVIDDSSDALEMLNIALTNAGMTALLAMCAKQGLMIAENLSPDIFVVDAMMPIIDGFTCCEQIRERFPLTPIIFMTGLTDSNSLKKAFDKGANDYLTKPIKPDELITRIRFHQQKARDIASLQQALDNAQQSLCCISSNGRMIWATPQARGYIDAILTSKKHRQSLIQWLNGVKTTQLHISETNRRFQIFYQENVKDNNHLLKIMEEKPLFHAATIQRLLNVTQRESEVLVHLAHGLPNKGIAQALDISPSTIKKHLEQIYIKLGVNNRTQAMAKVLQIG
ncbi:MAG: response regulator transcription factor [Cellvibrionales bacterium]|nr:response regulator transcription factor [Cellvibrionales bacterium]